MSGGPETFGALLRRLRQEAGLTQEELAERAGLSVRGISDLERGINRSARRETARLFAAALNLRGEERDRFLTAARARPALLHPPRGALPVPPTPLIGRAHELATVLGLLQRPAVRLVTLSGAGGVGKTRLALEAAAQAADRYPDGAWFVDLAPLDEPVLVADAIAQALAERERPRQSLFDTVAEFLGRKRILLVLDNFEHLLPATTTVAGLLARCPALTTLVTSRTPLRLRGEHIVTVPPLALPDGGAEGGRLGTLWVPQGRPTPDTRHP